MDVKLTRVQSTDGFRFRFQLDNCMLSSARSKWLCCEVYEPNICRISSPMPMNLGLEKVLVHSLYAIVIGLVGLGLRFHYCQLQNGVDDIATIRRNPQAALRERP